MNILDSESIVVEQVIRCFVLIPFFSRLVVPFEIYLFSIFWIFLDLPIKGPIDILSLGSVWGDMLGLPEGQR